ncbi:MAG: glucosamine-6-phosphate deaminase [Flavobacteriaceae bacterium]|nr:glucosamine-6-phosphate deaminase [Flavobacteriaceae bacterium]
MKKENILYQFPGAFEEHRFEKLHNVTFDSPFSGSAAVADEIAALIQEKQSEGKPCVLGLATGSSPISVYKHLIKLHQEEGLSFKNVITFNLDEYYGLQPSDINSYYLFMHENLFDHIDIPSENINIPDGTLAPKKVRDYCKAYEKKIADLGGLDFQLLGIGRTGHVGFNEPGSNINSQTRLVTLDHLTRYDAAGAFQGIDNVPSKAITMGIKTILSAKRIVLLAWGINKSEIILKAVEGILTANIPTTYLQKHENTTLVLDHQAASGLTRIKTPWITGNCDWSDLSNQCKAVYWLCEKTNKSILKLTEEDYNQNGMSELLNREGNYYDLNIKMFNRLQNTITGWPGGKPNADDSKRPERSQPEKKRSIIFSPHPDDDVISMGGTFDRLVAQGHEVHVAYQTSGNIAVSNDEALKYIEVITDIIEDPSVYDDLKEELLHKEKNTIDSLALRTLKGTIRKRESLAATRYVGIPDDQVHFLNLPFYESGKVQKNPPSQKDIDITKELISSVKPHQIYAAGDLADPHGTHRICLNILFDSIDQLKSDSFMKDCWVWLYRGAWQEFEVHEIEMAVPMSPDQVLRKRKAIFYHQSQKDSVMFQGSDDREFWVRAEDRNRTSAKRYRDLGLSDYQAMELFQRYHF